MAFFPGSDSMTIVTDEDESDEVSLASLHGDRLLCSSRGLLEILLCRGVDLDR